MALIIDGVGGSATVGRMQEFLGLSIDKVISGQSASFQKYRKSLTAVKNGKGGSKTVRELQRWLGITQDGGWGKDTSLALQKRLISEGYSVGKDGADGFFGTDSMMAWQKYLNEHDKAYPTPTPSGHYTGKYPELRVVRTNAEVIACAIKFGKWIADDNNFHYGKGKDAHHNGCYFCGTQPKSKKNAGIKMWERTYCCNPFVHACWAHGGLIPKALEMCMKGKSWGFKKGEGYDTSSLFTKVSINSLKAGDVLCSDTHVALYVGNGKVLQAGHEDNNVPFSSRWNSSINLSTWKGYKRAYRFNSSVNADIIIRHGEVSDRVGDLQRYLIWYGLLPVGSDDNEFGDATFTALTTFQSREGLTPDGECGAKSIARMKEVVR